MSVPSYSELGKTCRDFFSQGYYFGIFKLGTKNKTCREREVKTTGTHTIEDASSFWELETRKSYNKYYGIRYVSKWNTDGLVGMEIYCPLHIIPGVTVGVGGHYNFESKAKLGKLLTTYNHKNATLDLSVEGGDEAHFLANWSLVLGHNNCLAGYQISYDTDTGQVENNMALGYVSTDFTLHGAIENLKKYIVGVHHKTTANLETGVEMTYTPDEDTPAKMGIAVAYRLNSFTAFRAKFNSQSEVGLGYEMKIREGATLTLGSVIDGKNLNEGGGHKIGIGLEFEQ